MNHPFVQDKLQALFEEKLNALKRYHVLTAEMKALNASSDLQQMKSLLVGRQKYMRKIQTIDGSISAIRQAYPNKPTKAFSNKFNELYDRYRLDYRRIMEAVSPIDEKIYLMVERESEKIKTELLTIKKNKHAVSSYGSNKINISRYLDTKR